jgi:hypothetical protein
MMMREIWTTNSPGKQYLSAMAPKMFFVLSSAYAASLIGLAYIVKVAPRWISLLEIS